jgi:hypothetical protein
MKPVIAMTLGWVAAVASSAAGQHNADIWLGNQANRVAISPSGLVPGSTYAPLLPVDTFLQGWTHNNPGFDHVSGVQGGVAEFSGPVQIRLEVVDLDPSLYVIDNSFNVLELPGDRTLLGGADLHAHLTWFIDETDPGFDPERCVWEGRFRLIDTGTGLQPSLPFSMYFTNVPVRGGEFPPTPTPADGDFDGDRAVTRTDHAAFLVCFAGPQTRPNPQEPSITTCEVDCHNAFDFDDDLDVDLLDYAELQTLIGS